MNPRLIAHLCRPLRLARMRIRWVEDLLEIPLSDADAARVRQACAMSGVGLGEFYHWYVQKKLVSHSIRNFSRERGLAVVQSVDHTDYSRCEDLFASDRGILLALPHHAHYIFTVVALAEKLRATRKVVLFFGEPGRNPGNEVFDHMCRVFYGPGGNVETVHDTRQGIATAIRELKRGAAVVIMPDAYSTEASTLAVPFCGSSISTMLGTSVLARKTGAVIQPLVSTPHGKGLGFRTVFAPAIEVVRDRAESQTAARIRDYATMRRIFAFYEHVMRPQIVYWQHIRRHLSQTGRYVELTREQLPVVAALLEDDPDLNYTTHTVVLDGAA